MSDVKDEVLSNIAASVTDINKQISSAQTLIDAMREAGETTGELDAKLKGLIARKTKWENMLKARGYNV